MTRCFVAAPATVGLAGCISGQELPTCVRLVLVLLVWTNGTLRIPLMSQLWRQSVLRVLWPWVFQAMPATAITPPGLCHCFDYVVSVKASPEAVQDDGWYVVYRPEEKSPDFNELGHSERISATPTGEGKQLVDWRAESLN